MADEEYAIIIPYQPTSIPPTTTADTESILPRRSKRSSAAISPIKPTTATTPSQRPKKKARFSEPVHAYGTTGLTPAIGKAVLKTPSRRISTPAITRYEDHDEVQFTPLRQQLSARTQRQIRRLGLSDEQNQFYADKKATSGLQRQLHLRDKELQVMREELEATKLREASLRKTVAAGAEIASSQAQQQEEIRRKEAEVAELRERSFHETSDLRDGPATFPDDDFQIFEDTSAGDENQHTDIEDDLTVDLEFESAQELESSRQAKEAMFRSSQSFLNKAVQFEDSPMLSNKKIPSAPEISVRDISKELHEAINRAEEAEVALQVMRTEIQSLGFPAPVDDAENCVSGIKAHFHEMRLQLEHTMPGETRISFTPQLLMPEMLSKLKLVSSQIRDREAELRSMHEQQRSLRGNFDHALITIGKANAHMQELEDTIDKNAEEMLEQRMRAQAYEREAQEHQKNNEALIAAIEKYRLEVKRLEELVELIEAEQASRLQDVHTATTAEFNQQISDMDAQVAAETRGRRAAEESAVERLRKINELESALSSALQNSEVVKEQLQSLQRQFSGTKQTHTEEVVDLNNRISTLSTALTAANAQIEKLTLEVSRIKSLYHDEIDRGVEDLTLQAKDAIRHAAYVADLKKAHVRASKVKMANWVLESERDDLPSDPAGPMTPSSMVRFSEFSEIDDSASDRAANEMFSDEMDLGEDDHVAGRVALSRGKKRQGYRRHHSSSLDSSPPRDTSLPATSPLLGIRGILKKKPLRRRYDSGIGMDESSLSELDEGQGEGEDDTVKVVKGLELSSEADFGVGDVDVDVVGLRS